MAQAMGLEIPADELARISATLDALETAFRPLVRKLDPSVDLAATWLAPAEHPQ